MPLLARLNMVEAFAQRMVHLSMHTVKLWGHLVIKRPAVVKMVTWPKIQSMRSLIAEFTVARAY